MKLKQIDSFLSILSLMFRKHFLDMRMTYEYSENEEVAEVSISKIAKGSGVTLVPSAIFSVTESSVRFVKLDFTSDIDFLEFEVSSIFTLKMTVLQVVYRLIRNEYKDMLLYEFLTKVLSYKIDNLEDLLEYLCKYNDVEYERDPEYFYVYDYGNFKFFSDAISFMSTQSTRVVYKIDTETSGFNTVMLSFDTIAGTILEDLDGDSEVFVKIFKNELETADEDTFDEEGEEGFDDGFGGFGDSFGDDSFGGGGGGGGSAPTEDSSSDLGGGSFGGAPGDDDSSF